MKYPKWFLAERDELARRVYYGELERAEAIGKLREDLTDKDEDLAQTFLAKDVADEIGGEVDRLRRAANKELRRRADEAASGNEQLLLDSECDNYFPEYADSALLTQTRAYAEDTLGRATRHYDRAVSRMDLQERLEAAVGGNTDGKATFGQGKTALRNLPGSGTGEV